MGKNYLEQPQFNQNLTNFQFANEKKEFAKLKKTILLPVY